MSTIDSLYQQLTEEKETVQKYQRLTSLASNDPYLLSTLTELQIRTNAKAELLENTINHILEREVW